MEFLQWLIEIDEQLLLAINGCHNEYFDHFMYLFSDRWIWVPMYVAILYVMVINLSLRKMIVCLIAITLTITIADQVGASLIRPIVERMRPSNPDNPISDVVHIVNNYRSGRYGFPSCHAANTFGLAFFVCFLFRRRWLTVFLMVWAVVTCYSRVYLGLHYPGDLFFGMILGFLSAAVVYFVMRKLIGEHCECRLKHVNTPIYVGALTIVVISFISPFMQF